MIIKIKVIIRDPFNSKKFIGDVLKVNLKKLLNIKSTKRTYLKRTRKKFTTLKSPHVHKDAQTSFELVSYNITLKLKSYQISRLLSYYKKICCNLIPDAKIKITLKVSNLNTSQEKKDFKQTLNTNSLPDYLTKLGFFGKDNFYSH
jgi:ribosomal protein S10